MDTVKPNPNLFSPKSQWNILRGKERFKTCQKGPIFYIEKKFKLHFLKNFPRFDLTAFFCDFLHMKPFIFHWQSTWYRTGVMGGMHGWRVLTWNWNTHNTLCVPKVLKKTLVQVLSQDFSPFTYCPIIVLLPDISFIAWSWSYCLMFVLLSDVSCIAWC